ncbi:hypothetical protein CkaCkLH20_03717 [Colletotrichum karsti]|uniref:F-box domain-containing protein n=1 Tax=Colletotrichum karsti TaxID=1095194 RepID=A0A9P6I8G9_9PEZI|nr:uncharacterized protein CkaCkLH20_03717 [Colletotrichum karsti]KAF9878817.1 hypothetical protein CkaCkLH20_03717 [Colletotrichum karsti]
MGVSLDSMPPEILVNICNCLYDDDCAGSLAAFALASKRNHSMAKYPLARTIKFKLRPETTKGNNPLPKLVERHIDKLRRNGTFASVRRLVIDRIPPRKKLFRPKQESEREQSLLSSLEMLGEDDSKPESYITYHYDHLYDDERLKRHEHNRDQHYWASLAHLITQLPGLTDLLFAVRRQFPRCMLQAVHSTTPQCRLHLRYFRLHSVLDERLDPYDIELASSPCLHSIQCSYPDWDEELSVYEREEEDGEP